MKLNQPVQIKLIQRSNVLKIRKNNESKIIKSQIQNKFKQGHGILSYSQSSFRVHSSLYRLNQYTHTFLVLLQYQGSDSIGSFKAFLFNIHTHKIKLRSSCKRHINKFLSTTSLSSSNRIKFKFQFHIYFHSKYFHVPHLGARFCQNWPNEPQNMSGFNKRIF